MPGLVYASPNNWLQIYRTMSSSDPNIPAGYVLEGGCDGAPDRDMQTFRPGAASGGWPTYPPAATKADVIANLQNLNGSRSPGAGNGPY